MRKTIPPSGIKKNYTPLIILLSILVPVAIAFLYLLPKETGAADQYLFLPKTIAIINSITAIVLVLAFIAVKKRNYLLHRNLMFTALGLSVAFLLCYVTYHSLAESTKFGGEGSIRYIYYFLLITHIFLAAGIVPLVLISLSRALAEKYDKHRKIARITFPIWLYVTISGVIIYLMISPYY